MKLTAVILTKNEEENIERVLNSVRFCDEVVLIDDFSTDNTIKIAEKYGAKIYQRRLNADFAEQRNFGVEKAKYEWILFIDADEEMTYELKMEILDCLRCHSGDPASAGESRIVVNNNDSGQAGMTEATAYYIKRRDFFWGRELKYGETKKIRQVGLIRLIRKNSGKWVGKVHEEYKVKSQKSKVKSLENYINHCPHQSVRDFLNDINFYSSLRAKELYQQGRKTSIFAIIFYPLGKFLLTYIIKLGFLDGPAGFAYSFFMSFHSFLVRAKLWQFKIEANKSRYVF